MRFEPPLPKIPEPKPRNFAQERIDWLASEIERREKELPPNKTLKIYVAFANLKLFVPGIRSFKALNKIQIEVTCFDGEDILTPIYEHDKMPIMFSIGDLPVTDSEIIH